MSLTNENIAQMESCGVLGFWNELTLYIRTFIDRNHPLTQTDLDAIINDRTTPNIKTRQITATAMTEKLKEIIKREAEINLADLEEFKKHPSIEAIYSLPPQEVRIESFKQELLEARWNAIMAKVHEEVKTAK